MRKSWVVGAVAAAAVLAGAGYLAFGPAGSPGTPVVAVTPAAGTAQPSAEGKPVVLADATVQVQLYPDERVLGSADAPITIVEYASLTCPHCATFAEQVMPQLKTSYIEKGQVKFVFRDFPLDGEALQAAKVAQCVTDNTRYFAMIDTLFKLQHDWSRSDDVPGSLAKIAALAGLDKGTVDKCLADEALTTKIGERRTEAEEKFGVDSTPTFVVNGKVLKGVHDLQMLEEAFKDALPKG